MVIENFIFLLKKKKNWERSEKHFYSDFLFIYLFI